MRYRCETCENPYVTATAQPDGWDLHCGNGHEIVGKIGASMTFADDSIVKMTFPDVRVDLSSLVQVPTVYVRPCSRRLPHPRHVVRSEIVEPGTIVECPGIPEQRERTMDMATTDAQTISATLHRLAGWESAPCDHACTHVVIGEWTALGMANALARAAQRRSQAAGVGDDATPRVVLRQYLSDEPPGDWAPIDNMDADDVRDLAKAAVTQLAQIMEILFEDRQRS